MTKPVHTLCKDFQLATFNGDLPTATALLSQGADPHEKNINGDPILFTTLMLAASHDQSMKQKKQAIFEWLVKNFPHLLEQKNKSNDTVLHVMAVYGYSDLIKDLLKQSKKLVFMSNNLSNYPIHTTIINRQHACMEQLISIEGVGLLQDSQGRNALHDAARFGDVEMLRLCLNALPKDMVNSIDHQGQTPLIMAVIANNPDSASNIQELLNFGVKINQSDAGLKTALHYAVEAKNAVLVQLLLDTAEIDVNPIDENSETPLDLVQDDSALDKQISGLLSGRNAVHHKVDRA